MIGERVKKIRLAKKMSMTELADRSNVAKSYISSIERNIKVNPSIQILEKIAKNLEVPLNYLLGTGDIQNDIDEEWLNLLQQVISTGITKKQLEEFIIYKKEENQLNS